MLDIKFIRENTDLVAEAARKKGITLNIRELLGVDEKYRAILKDVETLRAELNSASEAISHIKSDTDKGAAIEKMQQFKEDLGEKCLKTKRINSSLWKRTLQGSN